MSKTDNTEPLWVRVRRDASPNDTIWHRCTDDNDCDLDSGPYTRCLRFSTNLRLYTPDGPTHEDIRLYWWGPERARTRDACLAAVRDWNTHKDTDVIVPTDQHRRREHWR